MVKVLINIQYGGFGISPYVVNQLVLSNKWNSKTLKKYGICSFNDGICCDDEVRFDRDLIEWLENNPEEAQKANGKYAELRIETIPDEYYETKAFFIDEYDGRETIQLFHDKMKVSRAIKYLDSWQKEEENNLVLNKISLLKDLLVNKE